MSSSSAPTILGFNRSSFLVTAGLGAAAFVGYCIYFDAKRRADPEYKNKIRQRRRNQVRGSAPRSTASAGMPEMPDPSDPASMQAFFLQEVQLGEELMTAGNLEEGSKHIANAVVLCGQGQQLLQIFQQTLAPEQFAAVVDKLPGTRERLSAMFETAANTAELSGRDVMFQYAGDGPAPPQIQELMDDEDLE